MYRVVEGNTRGLADVDEFIDLINSPTESELFDPSEDIYVARAPGRLDVMGGIADYSGSLVLEMPIAEATFAAVQRCPEKKLTILSRSGNRRKRFRFEIKLSELSTDYNKVRARFSRDRRFHWASYIVGVFVVLRRELGADLTGGARFLVSSQIPIGKGVSSSAALEVSTMQAVCAAFDIQIEPLKLALLCQKVENAVVGAPCGVMDQTTSHCGVENSLLSLLCQPAEVKGIVNIPEEIEFWGIDSGVRHAVAGSDYSSVRIGAFMGYRIITELAGFKARKIGDHIVEIDDKRWGGYLCNVPPAEYERELAANIPTTISGADFLNRYSGTTDTVTRIDLANTYAVKAPTEHAIYENSRVNEFSTLLQGDMSDAALGNLGELMSASHASYAACGLTESGTDRIVELVRENRMHGVFGARITGGGSGGTVAILAKQGSESIISEIAEHYGRETGKRPYIFYGSSPGCSAFGHLTLRAA
jgi:L-arabinokinase